MNKFKFEAAEDHRRSLQQANKAQHVQIINLLDKCTQILREDRIWLRNQIKAEDQEVLQIFKQYGKTKMQHLQIKLRKHVNAIKNRLKEEQLNKFKENLKLGISQPNPTKKPLNHHVSNFPREKSELKEKTTFAERYQKMSSIDTYKHKKPYQQQPDYKQHHLPQKTSTNIKDFQKMLEKHKINQQIIEERESQNVTSARLARHQNNKMDNHNLQRNSHQNMSHKISQTQFQYNNYMGSKLEQKGQRKEWLNEKGQRKEWLNEKEMKKKYEQFNLNKGQKQWNFTSKALKNLYSYTPIEVPAHQQMNFDLPKSKLETIHTYVEEQDQEKSIFHQHFSEKDHTITSLYNKDSSPKSSKEEQDIYCQPKIKAQSTFKPLYLERPSNSTKSYQDSKQYQELFTSPDLLLECRQFLKNKESATKPFSYLGDDSLTKNENIKINWLEVQNRSGQKQCLFNRNNLKEDIKSAQKLIQESMYSYPSIRESDGKKNSLVICDGKTEELNVKPFSAKNEYSYFETFSNNELNKEKINVLETKMIQDLKEKQDSKMQNSVVEHSSNEKSLAHESQSEQKFSIEKIIEYLLMENEMSVYINSDDLIMLMNKVQNQSIKIGVSSWLKQQKNESICLTDIAKSLQLFYQQKYQEVYTSTENTVIEIYSLLDIQQKGYISKSDIQSFISQISEAEINNLEEISDLLWKMFQMADFKEEQRITYWNLFIIKNTSQFENIHEILGEFEFQIEA